MAPSAKKILRSSTRNLSLKGVDVYIVTQELVAEKEKVEQLMIKLRVLEEANRKLELDLLAEKEAKKKLEEANKKLEQSLLDEELAASGLEMDLKHEKDEKKQLKESLEDVQRNLRITNDQKRRLHREVQAEGAERVRLEEENKKLKFTLVAEKSAKKQLEERLEAAENKNRAMECAQEKGNAPNAMKTTLEGNNAGVDDVMMKWVIAAEMEDLTK